MTLRGAAPSAGAFGAIGASTYAGVSAAPVADALFAAVSAASVKTNRVAPASPPAPTLLPSLRSHGPIKPLPANRACVVCAGRCRLKLNWCAWRGQSAKGGGVRTPSEATQSAKQRGSGRQQRGVRTPASMSAGDARVATDERP
jgi:hypothetical protein